MDWWCIRTVLGRLFDINGDRSGYIAVTIE